MLDKILDIAIEELASDIHLVAGVKPCLRVKRELKRLEDFKELTNNDLEDFLDKIIAGDKFKEDYFGIQRKLDVSYQYKDVKFRVNISRSKGIPVITMRLIRNELPTFEELGLPEIVEKIIHHPQGLILVTGKTNSGKSTTLNAIIDKINKEEEKKIITLENPVEYEHTSYKSLIVQKQIGKVEDSISFGDGVKNALREDADILVIGEIRDRETMDTAIEMAESGHLVIGTLHTKSCSETVDRIINFYDIKDQMNIKYVVSTLLKAVISQRLVKGLKGELVLIPEVMIVDNAIAGCIRKEKFSVSELEDLIQSGYDKGNISLLHALARSFINEDLSLEQVKVFVEEKDHDTLNRIIMQMKVKRG